MRKWRALCSLTHYCQIPAEASGNWGSCTASFLWLFSKTAKKKCPATSVRSENRTWLVPRLRTSHMPRAATCWPSFFRTCGSNRSTAVRRHNTSGSCHQEKGNGRWMNRLRRYTALQAGGSRKQSEMENWAGIQKKDRQTGELNTHRDNGDRHMQKQRGADTCVSERLIGPDMSLRCSDACSLLAGMSSQRG